MEKSKISVERKKCKKNNSTHEKTNIDLRYTDIVKRKY